MSRTRIIGFVFGAALLAACGSARWVTRTANGGVLAYNGDPGKAQEDAARKMASHCGPGNYHVVQEGETVIGQDSAARADTYDQRNGTTTTAASSTRDATEWRVTYECGQGGGPPPPPGPAPAPGGPPPPAPGY